MRSRVFHCSIENAANCPFAATRERIEIGEDEPFQCPIKRPHCESELIAVSGPPTRRVVAVLLIVAAVILASFYLAKRAKPSGRSEMAVSEQRTLQVEQVEEIPSQAPPPTPAVATTPKVLLRLSAGSALARDLVAPLASAYLAHQGVQEVSAQRVNNILSVQGTVGSEKVAIELADSGDDSDLTLLKDQRSELVFAARTPTDAEVRQLKGVGDFGSATAEEIQTLVARDGLAVIVHKSSKLEALSGPELQALVAGRITDWSQLKQGTGTIRLILPEGSDRSYVEQLAGRAGVQWQQILALQHEQEPIKDERLVARLAGDPSGIALVPLRYALQGSTQTRILPLSSGSPSQQQALVPTPFTIGTEDYLFHQRVVAYHPSAVSNPEAIRFLQYVVGDEAQAKVSRLGFADLKLRPQPKGLPEAYSTLMPQNLRGQLGQTEQLPVNFRFATDSFDLDFAAKEALDRVTRLLAETRYRQKVVLLFGFADAAGTEDYNRALSKQRATTVEAKLKQRGVSQTYPVGLGTQLPVADNETPSGMAQNRRVEIWLAEVKQ